MIPYPSHCSGITALGLPEGGNGHFGEMPARALISRGVEVLMELLEGSGAPWGMALGKLLAQRS